MKTYLVKFAYSGSKSREFFDVEFSNKTAQYGDNPALSINERIGQLYTSWDKAKK